MDKILFISYEELKKKRKPRKLKESVPLPTKRSQFDYYIETFKNYSCIIVEEEISHPSIIKRIVKLIEEKECINAKDYLIIYRNSIDSWDAWYATWERPIFLEAVTVERAISENIKRIEKLRA